jgi:hypothetical protein
MKKKLKHILDYNVLKEWGFIWAEKTNENVVIFYVTKEPTLQTDAHGFRNISLMVVRTDSWYRWLLSTVDCSKRYGKKDKGMILFFGVIKDKESLKTILESTIMFKPNPRKAKNL